MIVNIFAGPRHLLFLDSMLLAGSLRIYAVWGRMVGVGGRSPFRHRSRSHYSYLDNGLSREMAARSTIESIVLRVEYCGWGVRRSAGIVARSALNIEWDELKADLPFKGI